MFYSENILAKRGPLAKVWLAAHWERKLSKTQFLQTNIPSSISAIVEDYGQPMALRLSGQLLLGVVRIFSRKTRYLLEDCSEALVKIKMAFRPGLVDLTDEQAIATTGAITVVDSCNQFDMLMPDPVFDLETLLNSAPTKANTSRLQDITLQPDFLSFTQPLPDDLDQIGLDLSRNIGRDQDISIEVGRDAMGVREFTPGPDALSVAGSVREKSVGPNDPLLGKDISFELGLNGDALNNNEFDFDFANLNEEGLTENITREEKMLDFDDDYGLIEDFKLDTEKEALTISRNEDIPSIFNKNITNVKNRARKRAVLSNKKRKILIDEKIELSSEFLKIQLSDTRRICGKENFIPVSRMIGNLHKKKGEWLNADLPSHLLNLNQNVSIQSKDLFVADDVSFQMINDNYGDFDFDADHTHKRQKIESERDLSNMNGLQDLDDSIVFNHSLLENKPLDFDIAPAAEEDYLRGMDNNDNNSFKTLTMIESISSSSKNGRTSFFEMTKEATRASATKLFFELLSLKSKGAIDLSQEKPFSNIFVTISTNH